MQSIFGGMQGVVLLHGFPLCCRRSTCVEAVIKPVNWVVYPTLLANCMYVHVPRLFLPGELWKLLGKYIYILCMAP